MGEVPPVQVASPRRWGRFSRSNKGPAVPVPFPVPVEESPPAPLCIQSPPRRAWPVARRVKEEAAATRVCRVRDAAERRVGSIVELALR